MKRTRGSLSLFFYRQGIFSNGDIRAAGFQEQHHHHQHHHRGNEGAVVASEFEAHLLNDGSGPYDYPQRLHPDRKSYQQHGEPQGAELLSWLTDAKQPNNVFQQNANSYQMDKELIGNMQQNNQSTNSSNNVLSDEAMVLQAASSIDELRGLTLEELMKVVSEDNELTEKVRRNNRRGHQIKVGFLFIFFFLCKLSRDNIILAIPFLLDRVYKKNTSTP